MRFSTEKHPCICSSCSTDIRTPHRYSRFFFDNSRHPVSTPSSRLWRNRCESIVAFSGLRTSPHTFELFAFHSSLLVRNFGIGNTANSTLLRSLPQPQNPSHRRPRCPHRLTGHVHGGSYLLAHDPRSPPTRCELDCGLDPRLGALVSLVTNPPSGFQGAADRPLLCVGVTPSRNNPLGVSLGSPP